MDIYVYIWILFSNKKGNLAICDNTELDNIMLSEISQR